MNKVNFTVITGRRQCTTEQNYSIATHRRKGYIFPVAAKSVTERRKLEDLLDMANNSTPINRAFFVRIFRTPQRNNPLKIQEIDFFKDVADPFLDSLFLSMVVRGGQSLTGYFPYLVVFLPRYALPPFLDRRKSSGSYPKNSEQETTPMNTQNPTNTGAGLPVYTLDDLKQGKHRQQQGGENG